MVRIDMLIQPKIASRLSIARGHAIKVEVHLLTSCRMFQENEIGRGGGGGRAQQLSRCVREHCKVNTLDT